MNKLKQTTILVHLAPIVNHNWANYTRLLTVTMAITSLVIGANLWGKWDTIMPGDFSNLRKTAHIVSVSALGAALVHFVVLLLVGAVVKEVFRFKWQRVTGYHWIDDDIDPWTHTDSVLMDMAMKVHECQGDAKEFKWKFWHAHFLAQTLEHGHSWHGRQRRLGDITYYVNLYMQKHGKVV